MNEPYVNTVLQPDGTVTVSVDGHDVLDVDSIDTLHELGQLLMDCAARLRAKSRQQGQS